ncbi:zinc metalloproteinase nas-4-like [Dunckerocampus dactyliophorus]|uniref:zinc metalloproteinase nas-4-like n=1 Tax=Dunckerocampus dactyliophorus TaxID=161453 RepID=UPI002407096F|nr:zinc metalloproteinase nas-4-like [Dunckerocampus dactyliophorus]
MLLLFAALVFSPNLHHGGSDPIPQADKGLIKTLRNMKDNTETLEELTEQDHGLVEGDIVLQSDRNAVDRKWTTLDIPYVISPGLAARTNDIVAALEMISESTCLSFHQRTTEHDYIFFRSSKGCASYVGVIGGKQDLHVGRFCKVGNIVHEVLHALGFYHEHTRPDRKNYITIVSENIMKGRERNFQMQIGKTFQLPYDLLSIMHYGSNYFSANGRPTIKSKVKEGRMGQRIKMSPTDIQRVRLLYKCDSTRSQNKTGEAEQTAGGVSWRALVENWRTAPAPARDVSLGAVA